MTTGWYIATAGGDPEGPFDEGDLARAVAEGRLGPETLVWRDGMTGWAAAADVPAVARIVAPPAPPLEGPAPGAPATPPAPVSRVSAGAPLEFHHIVLLVGSSLVGFIGMAVYLRIVLPALVGGPP